MAKRKRDVARRSNLFDVGKSLLRVCSYLPYDDRGSLFKSCRKLTELINKLQYSFSAIYLQRFGAKQPHELSYYVTEACEGSPYRGNLCLFTRISHFNNRHIYVHRLKSSAQPVNRVLIHSQKYACPTTELSLGLEHNQSNWIGGNVPFDVPSWSNVGIDNQTHFLIARAKSTKHLTAVLLPINVL